MQGGVNGIQQDAARHRFSVRNPEFREQLELVRGPVPEIERPSTPILERVSIRPNMLQMHFRTSDDERAHRRHIPCGVFLRFGDE